MAAVAAASGALLGLEAAVRAALDGLRGGGEEAAAAPSEGGGGGGVGGGEGSSEGDWREALGASVGATSRAATQLSLAAASGQELAGPCGEAVRAVRALVSAAVVGLPPERGMTLHKAVRDTTTEVAEGLLRLTATLLHPLPHSGSPSQEQLICTGSVWEACDRAAHLPQDNQAAVASALSSCLAAVKDALDELEQALAEGGAPSHDVLEDEEVGSAGNREIGWSEADLQLLGPCVGLVKAAKASLKKLRGAVKTWGQVATAEQVAQLDGLADAAGDVSPSVDELVLSTYPPMNQLTLRLNAGKLAAVLKKMLELARASHVCVSSEESWVQFLLGATDHNMEKIKVLTQGVL